MNFNNGNAPKVPGGGGAAALLKVGAVIGSLGLYAAFNSLYNVEGGHLAIVFNRIVGIKDKVYPEGTHLMIPWFERPIIYDVRAHPHLMEGVAGSHDLKMVKIGLRVLTRPVPDQLPTIYQTVGENYNESLTFNNPWNFEIRGSTIQCQPACHSERGDLVHIQGGRTHRTTTSLIFKTVSREIWKILIARATNFNIALDDVSITTLTFGKEFMAAIEAKQVAAQDAERAKYVVEKVDQGKRSAVIRAQGEAKSAQLIGQAIANNPAFTTLRKIEAAREIAQTISHCANRVFLNSSDLLLNLQGMNLETPASRKK